MGPLLRLLICIAVFSLCVYFYLEQRNETIELALRLPLLGDELTVVREQNAQFSYEIGRFESPIHLMQLLERPEYSHLKHPEVADIIEIP